jgi:hypothetical protein
MIQRRLLEIRRDRMLKGITDEAYVSRHRLRSFAIAQAVAIQKTLENKSRRYGIYFGFNRKAVISGPSFCPGA